MPEYLVRLSKSANEALRGIRSRDDAHKVASRLRALETFPFMGVVYNPLYEAAKPPFEVLVTYAGHYGIYYMIDGSALTVDVLYLEDQRKDPMHRFGI